VPKDTLSQTSYRSVRDHVTRGGTQRASAGAEQRIRQGQGLDPLVDPKGLPHLGPVRMSLPRFEPQGDYWLLANGLAMAIETLLDTTGSMGDNVEIAFDNLPEDYTMLTGGKRPILGRYDVQICNAIFNDIEDYDTALLARSQFEMAEKIPMQLAMLPHGRNGCSNGKEDPQFGLFAAAYLTDASINKWGLKSYHFTVSDEPVYTTIDTRVVRSLFGSDVFDRINELGKFQLDEGHMPDTAKAIKDLQENAHAFFLQVGRRPDVRAQWRELYGDQHFIEIGTTEELHFYKAVLIGLTEGVLDLESAVEFMKSQKLGADEAKRIVDAVAHIPLGAQTWAERFDTIPLAGAIFASKTDTEPLDPDSVGLVAVAAESDDGSAAGPNWL